jgi:4-hydroxy-2-oxoheptanedioate aldolase
LRVNRVKEFWKKEQVAIGGWLSIPSGISTEIMAHQEWDVLTIDMQHALVSVSDMVPMITAISTTDVTPFVRVPWLEPGIIMKALDAGSYGVICPMINTREDAERFVSYCRYAPQGTRSFGPGRAVLFAGNDYAMQANDTILTLAMIETQKAMDNLEGILTVEGLDAVFVGPSDLGLSLGYVPGNHEEPGLLKAIESILKTAKSRSIRAGIFTFTPKYARQMIELGFDFVVLSSDARLLAAQAKIFLSELHME